MTRQEEIQEEIAKSICLWDGLDWEILPEKDYPMLKTRETYRRFAMVLMTNLDSQGVVLKVERNLPAVHWSSDAPLYDKAFGEGVAAGQSKMLKAGYKAVEKLVK